MGNDGHTGPEVEFHIPRGTAHRSHWGGGGVTGAAHTAGLESTAQAPTLSA